MKIIDKDYKYPVKIDINSGESDYSVFIDDSFSYLKDIISDEKFHGRKACIITDSNLSGNVDLISECISIFKETSFINCFSYVVPEGENSKSEEMVKAIITFLLENNFNRDDMLIALGGGVVTDLTGFVSAIYKRGINFFSIPTSLISMTDSSIGGKNGINFLGYKNEIGTFKNPVFVYINTKFLFSLTDELKSEGLVEIIKMALVYDNDFFEYCLNGSFDNLFLSEITDNNFYTNLIYNSILIKASICCEDPYDIGKRHILNFGHTIGHAIEKCSNYIVSHGQAVAIGIICALKISVAKGYLNPVFVTHVTEMFRAFGLKTSINQISNLFTLDSCMADLEENLLYYIGKDKKQSANGLKFVLLEAPGRGIISNEVSEGDILKSF